jgi:chitin disaccharide deacetylase
VTAKRLIVNADDFGFTRDVNAGIVECHRNGILTATTLMANGEAFADAVRLAKENPTLDIGVHLVLVGGPGQPESPVGLLAQIAQRKVDLYETMRLQVQSILATGIIPTHLDTHKHTHLAPPVLRALVRISREFRIPWVRKPADLPDSPGTIPAVKKLIHAAVKFSASRFDPILNSAGCRTTDHFSGFQLTGRMGTAELVQLLRALPTGLTELMCHPGYLREELRQASTRLKESREMELRALTAPETRAAISEGDIRLVSYRDL